MHNELWRPFKRRGRSRRARLSFFASLSSLVPEEKERRPSSGVGRESFPHTDGGTGGPWLGHHRDTKQCERPAGALLLFLPPGGPREATPPYGGALGLRRRPEESLLQEVLPPSVLEAPTDTLGGSSCQVKPPGRERNPPAGDCVL